MKENLIIESNNSMRTQKEIKIGKTIYNVNSVFQGNQNLEKILKDWIINKVLLSANN